MDDQFMTVLGAYHERMEEERKHRQAHGGPKHGGPQQGGPDRQQARPKPPEKDRKQERGAGPMHPVGPDTGRMINILAGSLTKPTILDLGSGFGYSSLWLADAARRSGGRLIAMEQDDLKVAYARDMAARAGLADYVDFRIGDALQLLAQLTTPLDFVLVDLAKDLYVACFEAFYPKLNPGAIVVADNMVRPGGENAAAYRNTVRAKPGLSSVTMPVGSGIEISRFEPV